VRSNSGKKGVKFVDGENELASGYGLDGTPRVLKRRQTPYSEQFLEKREQADIMAQKKLIQK